MPLYIQLTSEQEEALRRVAEIRQKTVEDIIAEWVQRLLEECADNHWGKPQVTCPEGRRTFSLRKTGRLGEA